MNYVITFTDRNCMNNILKVWLPSLQRNFSGKIVVITFDVNKEDIKKLKNQNVIVIEKDSTITGMYKVIAKRLIAQEEFINTLKDNDKIMLIDGADVVFQDNIDRFFDKIEDKILYSTTGTLTNKVTLKWFDKLIKKYRYNNKYRKLKKKLKNKEIIASGMLAGKKSSFLKYFKKHYKVQNMFGINYFTGINQIILTYLIIRNSRNFEKKDIHNCRLLSKDVIKENGLYKIHKTIPIIHFSCENQKKIYENSYLYKTPANGSLNILWLYGSNAKFDKINHWYHTNFAKVLGQQPNVNLIMYGYKMNELHPGMSPIPYNQDKKGIDIKKEFDFDVIIMDNKNRFAYSQTYKERKAKVPRVFWLKPEFFDGLDNIPKVFLEGDYHLHFRMNRPEEKGWYKKRKVDLLLVRHLSALKYHKDKSIDIQWFPCSVNTNIFKPNPEIQRKNKLCLIAGYGTNYYNYRNTAGKILKKENLIDIYNKRFLGIEYPKNLQSYICHISGSSIREITPAKMFEIMASGSVLFTDEGDEYGLKELFPDGSYVTYNKLTYEDVIEKGKKIIDDARFRNNITTKALQCIQEKHTHEVRAQELLKIITDKFNLKYNNLKNPNLVQTISKFFGKKDSTVITSIKPAKEMNLNTELQNKNIIKKLTENGIKICILKNTCYNVLIDNKIGDNLTIAVDDEKLAKELIGDNFHFEIMPEQTKEYIFENIKFLVPFPLAIYLKTQNEIEPRGNLVKKNKRLLLAGSTYKFVKRRRRKK